eukprot:TRINITY_DN2340_c0_g1_i3.p1 TRINITY_DN2340_c0_g1~~TRINITY_DN2340_c0_g1_i3.p1  ORF type:complete len:1508 (+),score=209.29 TRINITY_DN2340_c0_g1_i3:36-4526(+)
MMQNFQQRKQNEMQVMEWSMQNPHYFRDKIYASLREYQKEAFKKSCNNQGTLLVMPTGTGKTQVSFCIAEHVRGSAMKRNKPKPVLFLTQTRALACQQYRSCVALMTSHYMQAGGIVSLQDKTTDLRSIRNFEYVFGVTGAFSEMLRDNTAKLSDFCLVIFDEAHNVNKKSPGASVMKNHYQQLEDSRPFILGLTATPVFQIANLEDNINKLCSILGAKLCTVTIEENIKEMEEHEARGAPIFYNVSPSDCEQYVKTELLKIQSNSKQIMTMCIEEHNIDPSMDTCKKVRAYLENPNIANERPLLQEIQNTAHLNNCHDIEALALLVMNVIVVLQLTENIGVKAAGLHWEKQKTEFEKKVRPKQTAEYLNQVLFSVCKMFGSLNEPIGSKEQAITDIIAEEKARSGDTMRVLVFVETKVACSRLQEKLKGTFGSHPTLADVCVDYGHADKPARIAEFEEGATKVIICTTVYEEGIDIPTCSLVIRFFMSNYNIVALNQCRGRARRANARFVLMVESDADERKAKGNLDFSNIMNKIRELPGQELQDTRALWYEDPLYAERLVSGFAEQNKREYATPFPCIYYVDGGEAGWTALITCHVGTASMKFEAHGTAVKQAVSKLMYKVCGYLVKENLIDRVKHYHKNNQKIPMKMFETQNTAVVSFTDSEATVVYTQETWQFQRTPIDKLSELTSKTYEIDAVTEETIEGWLCNITLVNRKDFGTNDAQGRRTPYPPRKTPHGQGWATKNLALQNSAIVVLSERFNFSFVVEETPIELRDKVPEVTQQTMRSEIRNYSDAKGMAVSRFVSVNTLALAPMKEMQEARREPLPPVQQVTSAPDVPDATCQTPVQYTPALGYDNVVVQKPHSQGPPSQPQHVEPPRYLQLQHSHVSNETRVPQSQGHAPQSQGIANGHPQSPYSTPSTAHALPPVQQNCGYAPQHQGIANGQYSGLTTAQGHEGGIGQSHVNRLSGPLQGTSSLPQSQEPSSYSMNGQQNSNGNVPPQGYASGPQMMRPVQSFANAPQYGMWQERASVPQSGYQQQAHPSETHAGQPQVSTPQSQPNVMHVNQRYSESPVQHPTTQIRQTDVHMQSATPCPQPQRNTSSDTPLVGEQGALQNGTVRAEMKGISELGTATPTSMQGVVPANPGSRPPVEACYTNYHPNVRQEVSSYTPQQNYVSRQGEMTQERAGVSQTQDIPQRRVEGQSQQHVEGHQQNVNNVSPYQQNVYGHQHSVNGNQQSVNTHQQNVYGHQHSVNTHQHSVNGHQQSVNGHQHNNVNGHQQNVNHYQHANGHQTIDNTHQHNNVNGHQHSVNGHQQSVNGHQHNNVNGHQQNVNPYQHANGHQTIVNTHQQNVSENQQSSAPPQAQSTIAHGYQSTNVPPVPPPAHGSSQQYVNTRSDASQGYTNVPHNEPSVQPAQRSYTGGEAPPASGSTPQNFTNVASPLMQEQGQGRSEPQQQYRQQPQGYHPQQGEQSWMQMQAAQGVALPTQHQQATGYYDDF